MCFLVYIVASKGIELRNSNPLNYGTMSNNSCAGRTRTLISRVETGYSSVELQRNVKKIVALEGIEPSFHAS